MRQKLRPPFSPIRPEVTNIPKQKTYQPFSIAAVHSKDLAALQTQKGCASVQHFSPFPLFGRACWTSRYRMPPVLPSVGPEATLRTPDFRLPAIRPTFIFKPLRTNLSTPKIKKVANIRLQPNRPSGRLRRERDLNNPPNPQYINLLFGNKNQSTPNNPQIICIILPLRRTWSLQRQKNFIKRANNPNHHSHKPGNASSGHSCKTVFELFSLRITGIFRHNLQ